jgi:hypothetical protein
MRKFAKGDDTTTTGVPAAAVRLLATGWTEITDETPLESDVDLATWTPPERRPTTGTALTGRTEVRHTPSQHPKPDVNPPPDTKSD